MTNKQLWYTRRDKEIRGPFPSGLITRYILLGRVKPEDELSVDQVSWLAVSDNPDLIPDEMKLDLTIAENRDKLHIARMREDERETGDRRDRQREKNSDAVSPKTVGHKRSDKERRSNEANDMLRHREIKSQLLASLREKERESYVSRFVWLTFTLVVIAFFVVSYP